MPKFHFGKKKCVTKKLWNLAKKRNLNKTKKGIAQFKKKIYNHPVKYLTVDELYTHSCEPKNDIIKYIKKISRNKSKEQRQYQPRIQELKQLRRQCIQNLGKSNILKNKKKLNKYHNKHEELINVDLEYYVYKEFGKQYDNYKICHYCKNYDILNIDSISKRFEYFDITNFMFNPSKTCFSFCIDFIGNRNYHFFIKDLFDHKITYIPLHRKNETFISVHNTLSQTKFTKQICENYAWISDDIIIYIANDKYYNTSYCYTMNIRTKKRNLVYQENKPRQLSIQEILTSPFYFILYSSSYHSDEVYLIDIYENDEAYCIQKPILKDKPFTKYHYIEQVDATWYILKQERDTFVFLKTLDFKNFRICFTKKNTYLSIHDYHYMNECFIFFFKSKGKPRIELYSLCDMSLKRIVDSTQCVIPSSCHFNIMNLIEQENKLYFYTSSFTCQNRLYVLEIDKSHHYEIKEISFLNSAHSSHKSQFCEEVSFLKNNTIMITKIYKKGLKLHNCKCVLYGYGSYGDHYDATFNANQILNLCEKGFLVVITQISGDGALGFQQRFNGMLGNKKNSFYDFIYVAQYLCKKQITNKDKLIIWGRSAGGLLIGAVLNMIPNICKVAILGVPFISPFLTMSSPKNPLGFESHSEFGNPLNEKNGDYIMSYSPYQNIKHEGDYPPMLIYSNLNDTLVPYTEPYIYYNYLIKHVDVYKNKQKDLYLHIEDKFGHSQGSSLADKQYQYAILFTFIEKYIS